MCKCHINIIFMPSSRKRIGFLPSAEVQVLIDKLCKLHKLSQSKVTGILVEEALISRGYLLINKSITKNFDKTNVLESDQEYNYENNNDYLKKLSIKKDVSMINEFIEYKLFKQIMSQNNDNESL